MMLLDRIFASGFITTIILAVLAIEVLAILIVYKNLRGLWPALAAGACLVLALRSALIQYNPGELALWLGLAFVFHILEVRAWAKMSKHQPQ